MRNIITILLLIILIGVNTFMCYIGKIGAASYATIFVVIILASLALFGYDRLREIDLKNLKLSLSEMKQVKEEIFAEADTVKKSGEEIAFVIAYIIAHMNRMVGEDYENEMLKARDRIIIMLNEIGSSSQKIEQIKAIIEDMVIRDLKARIRMKIFDQYGKIFPHQSKEKEESFFQKIETLFADYKSDTIVAFLQYHEIWNDEISSSLEQLNKFIEEKVLT